MAITTITTIQHRRGSYADFDPEQMAPAELAIVQGGDPDSLDGKAAYLAFETGKVKRLATMEEMKSYNLDAKKQADIAEQYAQAAQEIQSQVAGMVTDATRYAGQAETAAIQAAQTLAQAESAISAAKDIAQAQFDSHTAETQQAAMDRINKRAADIVKLTTDADQVAKQALEKASNAENEVAESSNAIESLKKSGDAMKLLLEGKVDGAYVENGYLYLTSSDEIVAGPLGPFSGTGGGSGGTGGNNAELSVTNITGWLSRTIANGDSCVVKVNWSSVEDDMPTGNGSMKVTVNGVVKAIVDIAQGEASVDISKYLTVGSNVVKVNVADVYNNNRTINFSVTSIAISISSTFDASMPYQGAISFPFTPVGSVQKTVKFLLDGREIGSTVTSVSGRQMSFTIPQQAHGGHIFQAYFECDINGQTVKSNELYYEIVCLEALNETPIIASSFGATEKPQYAQILIPYLVYLPNSLTAEIELRVNGVMVSKQTVDRTQQLWSYRADTVGALTLQIVCGDVVKTFSLTITESDIDVEAETENLSLYLSSSGRSNNEENPAQWESGSIRASFEGFNWSSDGWIPDESGITAMRVGGDARLTIGLKPFAADFRITGKTIELEFATHDVMNYDSEIISCMSGGRGFSITSQLARLASEQSEISMQFKEDEHVRLAFVVEKRAEHRLIYIYINGIMSGCVQYPADDDFSQVTPVDITVGSKDAVVDLYTVRVYDNDLTRHQILTNWIADTQDLDLMIARYTVNSVFDDYSNIVISQLPADLPYLILEGADLPQYKGDKKTIGGSYVDPVNRGRSFTFSGAQIDVQGTSSQYYARKNYKIKFKGGFVNNSGAAVDEYAMNEDAIPTNTFTFKADVASSEGCNNVELVRLYNSACPYKTAPQRENPKVRQGIDGFPIVIFWNDGFTTTFLGKYNFNNDKGTPEVFGFSDGDESWEIKNNTSDRVLFKNDDFSGTDWLNDFEARYPEDNEDSLNLAALVSWIRSTDQEAADGAALDTPVTYEGTEYTADTAAYRLAKFKAELSQHMEVDAVVFYYLFTELYLMVDSRAKNAFPSVIGGSKWFSLPYDFDTAIGINNEGTLAFSYNLEDIDQTDTGADVYNGQQSVLWINLRQAFFPQIQAMYQNLRSTGKISYDRTESAFEDHQAKWPAAIFNEDAYFKYLSPLIESGNASYLSMLQGSKEQQRKWWLYNRFRYLDSKYNAGDALTDVITVRGYAKANITVTPYADVYASVKYGSYLVQQRAERNKAYELACPLSSVNDTEIYIYSASQLKSVGDLSGLKVGYADFSMAVKLQELKIGDASSSYSNTNLQELHMGNNRLLKKIDVRNSPNLKTAIDLSGCKNIEEIYLEGTGVTGLQLPNGGILKTLHVPGTMANLTVRNQRQITDFQMPLTDGKYPALTTLWLENSSIDAIDMIGKIEANTRLRLIGISWEFESADAISDFYDILDTMRGLDEQGNNMEKPQVSGKLHVSDLTGAEMAVLQARYPTIQITFDHIKSYCYFYNYDGSTLLYTASCLDGADAVYSGTMPSRASTAQYTYTFAGWAKTPNGSAVSNALVAVTADRNVYAAYTSTVRKYTVRFYNENTLLQTVQNVAYGSSARYTGETPVKTGVEDPENYVFSGWSPSPNNIQGDTNCYASYGYIGLEETITDTWEEIFAAEADGSYKTKYNIGDTKIINLGSEGNVCMQIIGFDKDDKADGSGKAPISWLSEQLLATSKRFNPYLTEIYAYRTAKGFAEVTNQSITTNTVKSSQNANCADSHAIATFTITASEDGEITVGFRISSNSQNAKITGSVNGEAVCTDYSSSTYMSKTLEVAAGQVVAASVDYYNVTGVSVTGQVQITGKCSYTIVSEDSTQRYISAYKEGSGTIGGWEKSELRAYFQETILPLIPNEVRSHIVEVTKTHPAYRNGVSAGSTQSYTQTTQDKVWIPSYAEMFSTTGLYHEKFPDSASRIKKKAGATSASWWWLRAAYTSIIAYAVGSSGSTYDDTVDSSGAVPLGFST